MPDYSAYASAVRRDGHQLRAWVSFYKGQIVASGNVTAGYVPSNYPLTSLTINVTGGSANAIRRGFLVRLKTLADGDLRGTTRVRYSGTIDSTHLPIRELSRGEMVVANGDRFEVVAEVRLSDKLVTADENFNPDGMSVGTFNTSPPPIANSGGLDVGWVDEGETFRTVQFFGDLSFPVDPDSGGSLTHTWTIPTGAGDFASGSTVSDENPVMEINVGSWLIEHTVEDDDNGQSTTQFIPVIVHDAAHPPHECLIDPLGGDHDNGWSYSVRVFDDATLDDIPDGSMAVIWIEETIGGVTQSLGSPVTGRSHIKGVGYIRRETTEETADEGESLTFEVISPLARLAETPGFSKVMIREASPDAWAEIRTLRTQRAMTQLMQFYCNLNEAGFDILIDEDTPDYDYPLLFLNKDNPLAQIRELARATRSRFICDRRGRFELQPVLNLMYISQRGSRGTQFPFTRDDILSLTVSREHVRVIETFRIKGFSAHATTPVPIFARWPGAAPGQGNVSGEATGIITTNESTAYTEVGLYGALNDGWFTDSNFVGQPAPRVTIRVPGSYDFLDFYGEWIELPFATNIRGIDLSALRFELVRASIIYVNGTAECEFELQAETHGEPGVADPQEQKDVDVIDPNDVWPVFEFPSWDGSDLIAGQAQLALLYSGSVVYTNDRGANWTGNALPLDVSESIWDGVQIPGTPTSLVCATNTKLRIYSNIIASPTAAYAHALRSTSQKRTVQVERTNPGVIYNLTYYSDGLWNEGSLDGGATLITAVRIGANFNYTTYGASSLIHPPVYVNPNNPLEAYTIAYDGSIWRWYKTTDGGVNWATTSDYNWSPNCPAFFIERSFTDPSTMYVGGISGSEPSASYPVYKVTAASSTQIASTGGRARRGFRTVDKDANKLLFVYWETTSFGNYDYGVYKSIDKGSSFSAVIAAGGPHNTMPGGVVGGDGKAVWVWKFGDLLYHPNFDTLISSSDFTSLAGTGFPTTSQAINLFGF